MWTPRRITKCCRQKVEWISGFDLALRRIYPRQKFDIICPTVYFSAVRIKSSANKPRRVNGFAVTPAMLRRLRAMERGPGRTFKSARAAVAYLHALCEK